MKDTESAVRMVGRLEAKGILVAEGLPMVDAAVTIAAQAHSGQKDKGGKPYIGHPLRVMVSLGLAGASDELLAAAVLHDTLEDTRVEMVDLFAAGLPELVRVTLDALTRRKDETYTKFIERIVHSTDEALAVKAADIADHLDPARAVPATVSLRPRYLKALEILGAELHRRLPGIAGGPHASLLAGIHVLRLARERAERSA